MTDKLSANDVDRLMNDQSADTKADTAKKVAAEFASSSLSDAERVLAEEIFRVMLSDAETRVREALVSNLKSAGDLSRDIAMKLANDVSDSVAIPMIRFSEALSDDDLKQIVASQPEDRVIAVASRESVSEGVSDAIVESGKSGAVATLVGNEGAAISEQTYHKVVDRYGAVEEIQNPLVHRTKLPVAIAEKLVAKVSDSLKDYLVTHHEMSEELAADLIIQSRERATIGLVASGADEQDVGTLVRQMRKNGRLTPSIILRALCVGDIVFFETALAELAGIPIQNARVLIHDEGELGLKALYGRAGMPTGLYLAFRSAVDLMLGAEGEKYDEDPEQHMRRMLERVLTENEEIVEEYGIENVDYLLAKFNKLSGPGANAS